MLPSKLRIINHLKCRTITARFRISNSNKNTMKKNTAHCFLWMTPAAGLSTHTPSEIKVESFLTFARTDSSQQWSPVPHLFLKRHFILHLFLQLVNLALWGEEKTHGLRSHALSLNSLGWGWSVQLVERDVNIWALRGQEGVGWGTETLRGVGRGQPLVLEEVSREECADSRSKTHAKHRRHERQNKKNIQ